MWRNSRAQASSVRDIDYGDYHFSAKESIWYSLQGGLVVGCIAYFFYRSVWACLLLLPVFFAFLKEKRRELAKKRRQELSMQFKDMILSLSANQKAGYSVENAVREAYRDMLMLYGKDSCICRELSFIMKGLDNNVVLEKLLYNLGVRSQIPDILQFAEVFLIAKRNGGNMTEILAETASTMEQKIEVDREIQVLISSKQMEQKIMNVVPFLIIFYISITSKGFFDVLYHNLAGIVIMTICLIVYFVAYRMSRQIVEIEV
ncbi:MAG: hypothetical protein J6B68_12630 [Lachnospiraceae bacterium]|nr:hypothetical protein [Lachnospiraceae bacterium]